MIQIKESGRGVLKHKAFVFSGGEISVKIEDHFVPRFNDLVSIYAHITNANEIMELALVVDALRNIEPSLRIDLDLPYLPYARQDRVCDKGESHSLRVFAKLLNSLNFNSVLVSDVHSDVALALIDRVRLLPVEKILQYNLGHILTNTVLVAPDAGAIKKVSKVAQTLNLPMVRADKIRDVTNGKILETKVYSENVGDKDFLVVDDICDGGRTFIELAKVLNPLTTGKLKLYVTHGIFSQGVDKLTEWYDTVYCAYPFPNVDKEAKGLIIL